MSLTRRVIESHLHQMRPQQSTQARNPRRIEFILVAVEDYVNVDVLIAIMVIFPLDDYGVEVKCIPKPLG